MSTQTERTEARIKVAYEGDSYDSALSSVEAHARALAAKLDAVVKESERVGGQAEREIRAIVEGE